ncbi:lamin tail domain-containing protein [Candidatus Roseilinea sp. NK_OTU-006]|uniref:lamin tail domain-containing protein n=1 Tax=Candidatus Roseilinea sp. NK_OTU-006 TaxID=2704250 RepID=UPI00145EB4DA|nr:lamin tail domain-containing protein [Candidatus Roseilinea sp. NK_OTU-006]
MRSRHKISLALCLSLVGLALILLTLGQAEGQEEEALLQRPVPLGAELGIAGVHTSAGAVVINEVAWGGTAANAAHEWIELYNTTDQPISLDGWQLVSSDGGPSITLSGIIPVFGYYLIERGTDQAISDTPADWVGNFGSGLSNSGEILTLTTPLGQVIDTANGNGGAWPAGSSGAGYRSMERIDPAAPDTDANWASNDGLTRNGLDASGNPINGTPKARNSISRADLVVEKSAPAPARPGGLVTYTLLVRNAYSLTAAAVHLTDTLPTELAFMTQTSPYTFTQLGLATLVWEMGDLPPAATSALITVTAQVTETPGAAVITNAAEATTATPEVTTTNNFAQAVTQIQPSAPALTLARSGPPVILAGAAFSAVFSLGNTGDLTASAVVLTDALPAEVDFITQTAPLPFSRPAPDLLRWDVGDLPPGASILITVALRAGAALSGTPALVATATESSGGIATASWSAPVLPAVRLYALAPVNYSGGGEAAALANLGSYTATLAGWCLDDAPASTSRVCFPAGAEIGPGRVLWLAQNGDSFYPIWGFDADWADSVSERSLPSLPGSWPGFTDGGEAAYLVSGTTVVDALAYGSGSATQGWDGPAIPYPYPGFAPGQVLYRKLDPATGFPVPDTDRAADWAQDPADPLLGRKLRYPGWDLEDLFFPAEITASARVTVAVVPEGALSLTRQTISAARHSLKIAAYTLESIPLYEAIRERIQAGVMVTILLESAPTGGMSLDEKWIAQRLHTPPNSTVYFIGQRGARYRFHHAKYILVDDRLALVSTDNFTERSMPSDLIVNGTAGHRGFLLATDSPGVVARLVDLFRRDADPTHADIVLYDDATHAPPAGYVPLPPPDWTTYTAPFSQLLATTATTLTVLHGPEHLLRPDDGLLGLLSRAGAGNSVAAMQLNESVTWTAGVGDVGLNPRIAAMVAAARRGAAVRLLLDKYYDTGANLAACLYLNGLARAESILLSCRLGNVTGLGVHAKAFFVRVGGEKWAHIGSVNGTETSNKANRELALQLASAEAYDFLMNVFEHDWARAHAPLVFPLYLPMAMLDYLPPADYPLVSEVFINPVGPDAGYEWIELHNPGPTVSIAGWTIGDAVNIGDYGDGRYALPSGAQLLRGQVMLLAACATNFARAYGFNPAYEWTDCDLLVPDLIPVSAWDGFGLALGNAQDEVLLLRPDGAPVDSAAWGGEPRANVIPFPLAPEDAFPWGASLKRYPPGSDRDNCARDFYVSWSPSPGRVTGE